MEKEWSAIQFNVMPYKKTDTYILKSPDEASQLLDDHIIMTQSMSFSPYKKPFEQRISAWENKLKLTQVGPPWESLTTPTAPTLTAPCPIGCSLRCLEGAEVVVCLSQVCTAPGSDRPLMQRKATRRVLCVSEVQLLEEAVQRGWASVWSGAVAEEGHESCQQNSGGLPGLGTASTCSRGTFWAGYHEALRFLSALSRSILSLPFPSHLELA